MTFSSRFYFQIQTLSDAVLTLRRRVANTSSTSTDSVCVAKDSQEIELTATARAGSAGSSPAREWRRVLEQSGKQTTKSQRHKNKIILVVQFFLALAISNHQ